MGRGASSPIFRGASIGVLSVGKKYLLTGICTSDSGAIDTAVDNRQLDRASVTPASLAGGTRSV